ERGEERAVSGRARRRCGVALDSPPSGAVQGGRPEPAPPLAFTHLQPLGARRDLRVRGVRSHGPVPGTRFLADVAPEDPVADALLDRVRKRTAVLDRPVSEAAGGIEQTRLEKGAGGTALQASDARSAQLRDRIVR